MAEKRVRLDPPDAAGRPLSLQEQLTRERAHSALLAAELAALRAGLGQGGEQRPEELSHERSMLGLESAPLPPAVHAGLANLAMDALSEGISIADCTQPDAPLIYVNSGFCRMTGFSKEETVGHNCRFLQGCETDPSAVAMLRAAIAAGQSANVELMNYRKDGTPFRNALSVTPIRAASGRVTHYVGIQSDVTQLHAHREAELAALTAVAEAEAATAAKSRFLAHMSHEIRTPLNGILAVGQMLEDTSLTEEQRDLVGTIRTSGESLLSLICDILDFSRIEAQKLLLEEQPFLLEEALERTLQICGTGAAKKRINVTYTIDADVPRVLVGDVGRLQQVLLNALGNSVKFTQAGGVVQLRCGTQLELDGTQLLHIAVIDNGIGISPSGLAKLFASFSQVDSSPNRKYDGAGLGLAISRRLCEAMGGTMRAESPGLQLGSTFHVTTSLKAALPCVAEAASLAFDGATPLPALAGRRVIVADGCSAVRSALAVWLRSWGATQVAEAESPAALRTLFIEGPGYAAGGGAGTWDAVFVEATPLFLRMVLAMVDDMGPACALQTMADSLDGGAMPGPELGRPPAALPGPPHSLTIFALSWPSMPSAAADPLRMYGAIDVAPQPSGERVQAQDVVPGCFVVSKPVRQSRLREALVNASFGVDPKYERQRLLDQDAAEQEMQDPLSREHLAPLEHSHSVASFASCGEVEPAEDGMAGLVLHTAVPPRAEPVPRAMAPALVPAKGVSLRVFLAEDHLINQKVVCSLLKRYGHRVDVVANDGLDALAKLRATPGGPTAFDVILMDLHMPRMGGMECSSAIAEEWPMHGTPIIAVTADAFEESRQRCLDAGFTGWLSKPFRIDGMLNILSSILAQVELRRSVQAAAAS